MRHRDRKEREEGGGGGVIGLHATEFKCHHGNISLSLFYIYKVMLDNMTSSKQFIWRYE